MIPDVHLSICVQAYNEEDTLAEAVGDLLARVGPVVGRLDVIIVNDGSSDATPRIAESLAAEHAEVQVLHHKTNQGIGACFRSALAAAHGDYYTDFPGDHENSAGEIVQALRHLDTDCLVTTHHRGVDPRPLRRRLISYTYTGLLNATLRLRLRYFNGLTIFPAEALREMPLTINGFFFSAEALVRMLRAGYEVKELSYPLQKRDGGKSTALGIRSLFRAVRDVVVLLRALRAPRTRAGRSAAILLLLAAARATAGESRIESVEIAKPWSDAWYELPWGSVILQGDDLRVVARLSAAVSSVPGFAEDATLLVKRFSIDTHGATNRVLELHVPVTTENAVLAAPREIRITVPAMDLQNSGLVSSEEDGIDNEYCSADSSHLVTPPPNRSGRRDSDRFDADLAAMGGAPRGRARGRGNDEVISPEGEMTQTFLKAAGAALFYVEVDGVRSPMRQIQDQCDIFYISGHARYSENCFYASELSEPSWGDELKPEDVRPHWRDVDVVIFATCSILDIGDYNSNFHGTRSPGKRWATTGAEWYLGYNYLSPSDSQDEDRDAMSDIVHAWHTNAQAGMGMEEAWRAANFQALNPRGKRIGSNACVIHVPRDGAESVYWFFSKGLRGKLTWTSVPSTQWP